jgi:FixJ family two-component response regulator
VFSTADGAQWIEIYTHNKPGLVLLDLALPCPNGLEVMQKLKELDADANIPVVTGFALEELVVAATCYGVHERITKPVQLSGVIERVKFALHETGKA